KQRLFVRNARNIVTCMELLSGSNWLFHGLRDGTIDVFDVYRGQAVPYRIPNIIPEGRKHSLVVSIKTHPKDNNQLLIAYNTGVALWNLKQKTVIQTFIYEIPPGAVGGIPPTDEMGFSQSRYPQVNVIAWRPDGLGFVSGYDDGCIVFWDIRQEKPVMARTIHEVNVNVAGNRPPTNETAQCAPIYQLSWCLHGDKSETTLIIAGGAGAVDMFGIHLFEFSSKPDYRHPKRHYTLKMETDILDFVVFPRESPWFNGALDPVSILVLTNRGGVKSFGFDASPVPQILPSTLALVEPRLILAKTYGQLPPDLYNRLVYSQDNGTVLNIPPRIPLRGIQLAPVDESKLCRDILITAHTDRSIRFWEGATFRPLHHLTVELDPLFFKDQVEIAAFEFSVHSHILAVGFSNGNWIYGQLSTPGELSQLPSHAHTASEEFVGEALAADLKEAMNISGHEHPAGTVDAHPVNTNTEQIPRNPQFVPDHALDQPQHSTASQEPSQPQQQQQQQQQGQPMTDKSAVNTESGAPAPSAEDPNHSISPPVDPTTARDLAPGELTPGFPPPDRAPSPSLPPRPAFVEVSLSNGSEFSPVFKSSSHLGRVNQIAISRCGLVAVSDEFYSLSITDIRSGKVLHVEDLKFVMLDQKMNHNSQDHDSESHRPSHPTDPNDLKALQRVGVVITTLQFVVSTTSDQDRTLSLLLIAGSTNGIYLIFAITPPFNEDPQHPWAYSRKVRKVETFQTKEQFGSVHTSIINVISPSENPTSPENPTPSAATSASSSSTGTATAAEHSSVASVQQQQQQPHPHGTDTATHPHHPQQPHSPTLARLDEGSKTGSSHRSSPSESSIGESGTTKGSSIYSTWKEAQEKVMTKAQQRLNYLVCVSEFGIRLHMNCTSRRIHKVNFCSSSGQEHGHDHSHHGLSSKVGRIMAANVVYHQGACCILCVTESGRILLFNVPKLELIPLPGGELHLPIVLEPERLRETVILSDGRIFVPILKYEFRMYSLWGHDRWVMTPQGWTQERFPDTSKYLQLYDHGIQIPPRPTPTSSKGWFSFGSSAEDPPSQEDLDELLGGEHYRAENPILKRAGVHGAPGTAPIPPPKEGASTGVAGTMNQTLQGLDERGQKLGLLHDKTAEMSAASNSFLAAARELNAKNANKKWYEF
ncbi:hypothetical protein BGX34_004546, partial [Mortierella sp. NVP85]